MFLFNADHFLVLFALVLIYTLKRDFYLIIVIHCIAPDCKIVSKCNFSSVIFVQKINFILVFIHFTMKSI